jgi:hypothetical protein
MKKVHIEDARKDGFVIDTCCNPPIAYKGPRFQPTEYFECYTPLESALLANTGEVTALLRRLTESVNPFRDEANGLLAKLESAVAEA